MNDTFELQWKGKKPVPGKIHVQAGFKLPTEPEVVVQQSGIGALATFARQFTHPEDRLDGLDEDTIDLFRQDWRQFPPHTYRRATLLKKGTEVRQPWPQERSSMMGLPQGITDPLGKQVQDPWDRRKRQNSLIGDAYHVPSVMWVLILLSRRCQSRLLLIH
jgi:hypothetical protein